MKDKEIFYKTNLIGVLNTKVLNYLEFNKILAKFIGVPHTTLQLEENLYIQANQSLFGYSIKTFSCIDNIKKPPFGSKK